MEHVVFWSAPGGTREFARVAQLPDAVELVERLRNRDGITDATVHSLTDVPVAFRTYYVAEVAPGIGEPAAGSAEDNVEVPAAVPEVGAPDPHVPDVEVPAVEALAPDEADAHPADVPSIEPVGHPALSVVPDMIETSPEPELETEAEPSIVADATPESGAEAVGGLSEGSSRSLGLFA